MNDKSKTSNPTLTFRDGMLSLDGDVDPAFANKFFKRHPLGSWIAPAYRYADIISFCNDCGVRLDDGAAQFFTTDTFSHQEPLDPFDFQTDAIHAWEKADRKGLIVLPTGAGKSFMTRVLIARIGMEDAQCSVLVVVPMRALRYQWCNQLHIAVEE